MTTIACTANKTNGYYQSSSSSSLFAIACFLAFKASAKLPAMLGVGVLLLLASLPDPFAPFKLMPESLFCSEATAGAGAGLRPATGRLAGG